MLQPSTYRSLHSTLKKKKKEKKEQKEQKEEALSNALRHN